MSKSDLAKRIIVFICLAIVVYGAYYVIQANLDARLAGMGF